MAAEDGAKLTHDVWFVFPIVFDKHSIEVWSAGDIVGWKLWRSHVHLPNTTHSIYLDEKYNGVKKLLLNTIFTVVNNTLSQSSMYLDFNIRYIVLRDFVLNDSLDLGHSQTRSKKPKERGVTAIALGHDKLLLDLLCSRKGLHVAGVMCHEMLLALPTSHHQQWGLAKGWHSTVSVCHSSLL